MTYDYINSDDKFNDQQLLSKDKFFSLLTDEGIPDEARTHAQKVWNTFNVRSMAEYRDLYLKSDTLLLA